MRESHATDFPFVDLDLTQRLERAEARSNAGFVEARAKIFPNSEAQWIEVAGAYAMFDTPTSPLTQTFGLGVFDKVTSAELERLETFFRERQAPVYHEISPLAQAELFALLNARGYEPFEFTSVMFRPIHPGLTLASSRNEKIRVRQAREGEHDLWANISVKGWSAFGELADFMTEVAQINSLWKGANAFFAESEGQPIATGMLCLNEGIALLGGACTIPEARKQGAQLALLEKRLRFAAEQGHELAMMCAQPGSGSQRNAERHGFRIAHTRIKWRLKQ